MNTILILFLFFLGISYGGPLEGCKFDRSYVNGFGTTIYNYTLGSLDGWQPGFFEGGYAKGGAFAYIANLDITTFSFTPDDLEIVNTFGIRMHRSNFTFVFDGYFLAPESGEYTFRARTMNSLQFQIGSNGSCCDNPKEHMGEKTIMTIMNKPGEHVKLADTIKLNLKAGMYYPIKLVWFNQRGEFLIETKVTFPSGRHIDIAKRSFKVNNHFEANPSCPVPPTSSKTVTADVQTPITTTTTWDFTPVEIVTVPTDYTAVHLTRSTFTTTYTDDKGALQTDSGVLIVTTTGKSIVTTTTMFPHLTRSTFTTSSMNSDGSWQTNSGVVIVTGSEDTFETTTTMFPHLTRSTFTTTGTNSDGEVVTDSGVVIVTGSEDSFVTTTTTFPHWTRSTFTTSSMNSDGSWQTDSGVVIVTGSEDSFETTTTMFPHLTRSTFTTSSMNSDGSWQTDSGVVIVTGSEDVFETTTTMFPHLTRSTFTTSSMNSDGSWQTDSGVVIVTGSEDTFETTTTMFPHLTRSTFTTSSMNSDGSWQTDSGVVIVTGSEDTFETTTTMFPHLTRSTFTTTGTNSDGDVVTDSGVVIVTGSDDSFKTTTTMFPHLTSFSSSSTKSTRTPWHFTNSSSKVPSSQPTLSDTSLVSSDNDSRDQVTMDSTSSSFSVTNTVKESTGISSIFKQSSSMIASPGSTSGILSQPTSDGNTQTHQPSITSAEAEFPSPHSSKTLIVTTHVSVKSSMDILTTAGQSSSTGDKTTIISSSVDASIETQMSEPAEPTNLRSSTQQKATASESSHADTPKENTFSWTPSTLDTTYTTRDNHLGTDTTHSAKATIPAADQPNATMPESVSVDNVYSSQAEDQPAPTTESLQLTDIQGSITTEAPEGNENNAGQVQESIKSSSVTAVSTPLITTYEDGGRKGSVNAFAGICGLLVSLIFL